MSTFGGVYTPLATADYAGGNGNLDVNPPPGLGAGDMWVIYAAADLNTGAAIGVPAGFTAISAMHQQAANYPGCRGFWKAVTGTESAVTIQFTSVYEVEAASIRIAGANSLDVVSAETEAAGGTTSETFDAPDVTVAAAASVALTVVGYTVGGGAGTVGITPPSGMTAAQTHGAGFSQWGIAYQEVGAGAFAPGTWAISASAAIEFLTGLTFVVGQSGASASLDQEGFRFGNDDGAENAHTWAAAQDVNITAPAGETRLINIIVNAAASPGAKVFSLERLRPGGGSNDWERMEVMDGTLQ